MKLEVVILAAGQGTRMKSDLPKVLHPLAGRPLLQHVIETALELDPAALHVVTGHGAGQVRQALSAYSINWVEQEQQLGTGHAVLQAMPFVQRDNVVLVLYGDVPLTRADTLRALVTAATDGPALLTAPPACLRAQLLFRLSRRLQDRTALGRQGAPTPSRPCLTPPTAPRAPPSFLV